MRFLTPEEKVPQKLQETLDAAFAKAFTLIYKEELPTVHHISDTISKTASKDVFCRRKL